MESKKTKEMRKGAGPETKNSPVSFGPPPLHTQKYTPDPYKHRLNFPLHDPPPQPGSGSDET